MRSCAKGIPWLAATVAGLALAVLAGYAADQGAGSPAVRVGTAKGGRVVIDEYTNHQPKTVLRAGNVAYTGRSNEVVDAADVTLEMFSEAGETEALLKAGACRYNTASKTLTSETNVFLQKGSTTITGHGLEWSSTQEVVRILARVKVVFEGGGLSDFRNASPGNKQKDGP